MKYLPIMLLIICVSVVSIAGCDEALLDGYDYDASEPFSYEIPVTGQARFIIDNVNGSIEIIGISETGVVNISGIKTVKSTKSTEHARSHLSNISIEINDDLGEISIATHQPGNSQKGCNHQVKYHIEVPSTWLVTAEQTNGRIAINSIANDIAAKTVNGDLTVENCLGAINVDTANGSIQLIDVSGSINGEVTNGRIQADISLLQPDCRLSTTNGPITLGIPADTSAKLSARTMNGSIDLSRLKIASASTSRKKVEGILGEGEGVIDLKTVNGNIDIVGY